MLAFPQSSFPPQVLVNLHMSVCSPFTLNTRTHVWEHPYQRRWRPGTPRADWRVAWGMDSPAQICLILPQAASSVSLSAWEHICIVPGFLVTLPQGRKWGLSCRSTHGLCTDRKSLVQFSRSVLSDSLLPHGLQHARLPCPSPACRVYSKSCPLSQWCHPTISSSVILFSSCLQSSPASGSFQMSQFFASGGQSIGLSASVSGLSMNIQDWFPLGGTSLISLPPKRLSRVFSNATVQNQSFGTQLSLWPNSHIHTWLLEKP